LVLSTNAKQKMLLLTTLALLATSAFAAPQVQQLEKLADELIAEIAKGQVQVLDGVLLKGLDDLKRSTCTLKVTVKCFNVYNLNC